MEGAPAAATKADDDDDDAPIVAAAPATAGLKKMPIKRIPGYHTSLEIIATNSRVDAPIAAGAENDLCAVCRSIVTDDLFSICCDKCDMWVHGNCIDMDADEGATVKKCALFSLRAAALWHRPATLPLLTGPAQVLLPPVLHDHRAARGIQEERAQEEAPERRRHTGLGEDAPQQPGRLRGR